MALNIVADERTELGRLIRATNTEKPSKEDRRALYAYLEQHGVEEIVKTGALTRNLISSLIDQAFGRHYGLTVAIAANIEQQREDLGYEKASPLERQLIDHLLLCQLRLSQCEALRNAAENREQTLAQFEHMDKRLTTAQRRYLRAVETLAKVRRLAVNVQVNIGNQQVITR